jgi:hypothetical protein
MGRHWRCAPDSPAMETSDRSDGLVSPERVNGAIVTHERLVDRRETSAGPSPGKDASESFQVSRRPESWDSTSVQSADRRPRRRNAGTDGGQHGARVCDVPDRPVSRNHAESAERHGEKCAWQESNLRPRAPEARALSPELQARGAKSSVGLSTRSWRRSALPGSAHQALELGRSAENRLREAQDFPRRAARARARPAARVRRRDPRASDRPPARREVEP